MTKKLIITGAALLAAGAVVCTAAFAAFGFNWKDFGTSEYETNTYPVSEDFSSINIESDTEDIIFVPSKDGKCKVECYTDKDTKFTVQVNNDVLNVERVDKNKMKFNFGINTESPKVTVYLPENDYEKLIVKTDTGDLSVPKDFAFESISAELDTGDVSCFASASGNITFNTDTGDVRMTDISSAGMTITTDTGDIDLSGIELSGDMNITVESGDIKMNNVSCTELSEKSDTGDHILTNVIASGKIDMKSDTGDIKLSDCDGDTVYILTDTGDVSGTLLTDKIFTVKSATGDVSVPSSTSGGMCQITSDTGDIRISIK